MGVRRASVGPVEPVATSSGVIGDGARALCPWCGSERVERIAAFGPQLISEQYMCLDCRSPFERIKR